MNRLGVIDAVYVDSGVVCSAIRFTCSRTGFAIVSNMDMLHTSVGTTGYVYGPVVGFCSCVARVTVERARLG
jgi:hypothetical protein